MNFYSPSNCYIKCLCLTITIFPIIGFCDSLIVSITCMALKLDVPFLRYKC